MPTRALILQCLTHGFYFYIYLENCVVLSGIKYQKKMSFYIVSISNLGSINLKFDLVKNSNVSSLSLHCRASHFSFVSCLHVAVLNLFLLRFNFENETPTTNFDTFPAAILTVFQVRSPFSHRCMLTVPLYVKKCENSGFRNNKDCHQSVLIRETDCSVYLLPLNGLIVNP